MAYDIEFDPDALDDLKRLDRPVQPQLLGFLKQRVATLDNPREISVALAGAKFGNYWNYRVGDWRIICDCSDSEQMGYGRSLSRGQRGHALPAHAR